MYKTEWQEKHPGGNLTPPTNEERNYEKTNNPHATKKGKGTQSSKKQLPAVNGHHAEIFDSKKKELYEFSSEIPAIIELDAVITKSGLFNWFDHAVTGDEFNQRLSGIQDIFIKQNNYLKKVINEFNTVYETFSALDKEYIQGILISLRAAEEANKKAVDGLKGVEKNQIQLKNNQDDLRQIIENNGQVLDILKAFKTEIESIKHISEIDDFFIDLESLKEELAKIKSNNDKQQTRLSLLEETVQVKFEIDAEKLVSQGKALVGINSAVDGLTEKSNELARKQEEHDSSLIDLKDSLMSQEKDLVNQKAAIDSDFEVLKRELLHAKFIAGVSMLLSIVLIILLISGVF